MDDDLNLEMVECRNQIVVKCRLFISYLSVDKYFSFQPDKIYEDKFYDKTTFYDNDVAASAENGAKGVIFRRRVIAGTNNEEIVEQVKQETKHLTPNSHIYEQTDIFNENWPFTENDCFLSFIFERYELAIPSGGNAGSNKVTKCTLDKVTSLGVNYCVLNLSRVFKKSQEWDDIRLTAQREMISFLRNFSLPCYPVYTKFMYMLRLSPNFELFDDVFKSSCAYVDDRIEELVDRFLGNDKPRQNKEYVWVTTHVHELFEHCIGVGMAVESAIEHLNKKRKSVVDNDSVSFRHAFAY